jgi:hypothetical protein
MEHLIGNPKDEKAKPYDEEQLPLSLSPLGINAFVHGSTFMVR